MQITNSEKIKMDNKEQIKNFLISRNISSDDCFKEVEGMDVGSANDLKKYVECFGIKDEKIENIIGYYNNYFLKAKDSKLNLREQIYWLMIHGVIINDEKNAREFLTNRNYFYKIIHYIKSLPDEKFDFTQLIDLSTIDMELRYVLLKASLDVEHAIKTFLSRIITNSSKHDGYKIVSDVFRDKASDNLKQKIFSPLGSYENGLFKINDEYEEIYNHPSFWFVIENTTLGKVSPFVTYLSNLSPQNTRLNMIKGSIYNISKLRNKAAHSNGILNEDIIKHQETVSIDDHIYQLLRVNKVDKELLKTPLISQIAILMLLHKDLTSEKMHYHRIEELKNVIERSRRKEYEKNSTIYRFISDLNRLLTNQELMV